MAQINKKSVSVILFILLVLGIGSFMGYDYFKTSIEKKEEEVNNALNLNKTLKSDQNRIHVFDAYMLPKNLLLFKLSNFDVDTISITKLDLKKPKIVFRFTDLSCESCINQELIHLKALEKEIGKENIVYLGSFSNIRKAISFNKVNALENSTFYFINYGDLGSDIEAEHLPFVFMLDQSMQIDTPFFPRYDMPDVSVDYYKVIKEKYFVDKKNQI